MPASGARTGHSMAAAAGMAALRGGVDRPDGLIATVSKPVEAARTPSTASAKAVAVAPQVTAWLCG